MEKSSSIGVETGVGRSLGDLLRSLFGRRSLDVCTPRTTSWVGNAWYQDFLQLVERVHSGENPKEVLMEVGVGVLWGVESGFFTAYFIENGGDLDAFGDLRGMVVEERVRRDEVARERLSVCGAVKDMGLYDI